MGQDIRLKASDNFELSAYRADPGGTPKGAMVVIQEIFGVNHHIRSICDRLAREGYVAIAPSIFDRSEPNFQSGYSPDEIANARKFVANPDWAAMLRDTQGAIDAVKNTGPVGIIGFCLGGSIAFVAATRLSGLKAANPESITAIVSMDSGPAPCGASRNDDGVCDGWLAYPVFRSPAEMPLIVIWMPRSTCSSGLSARCSFSNSTCTWLSGSR